MSKNGAGGAPPEADGAPPADGTQENLKAMKKDALIALATRLKVSPDGTAADLRQRIEAIRVAEEADELAKQKITKVSSDSWVAAILKRQPKVDLSKITLTYDSGQVLVTPAVWPALLWRHPLGRSELWGPIGSEGVMMIALTNRWKTLLKCSDAEVLKIRDAFTSLWLLMESAPRTSSFDAEEWCRLCWILHVAPAIKLLRELQASKYAEAGFHDIARKVRALGYCCSDSNQSRPGALSVFFAAATTPIGFEILPAVSTTTRTLTSFPDHAAFRP